LTVRLPSWLTLGLTGVDVRTGPLISALDRYVIRNQYC
jgi:hypothetical protein